MDSRHDLRLHDELVRLTRGMGGLRLAIADGVERLVVLGGVQTLGFPIVESYARERLGRSGRWMGDARTLLRRLVLLPRLREAYLSGRLSTSKVELLARQLVRGENDGLDEEGAIAMAASSTVRELRRRLGGRAREADLADDERRRWGRWVHLTRHVDRVDAVAFEGVIRLMEAMGETTRSAAIDGLLAEGLTTLLNRAELAPDLVSRIAGPVPGDVGAPSDPARDVVASAEPDTDIGLASEQPLMEPPYIDPAIVDVGLLDLELRALSAELTRRDLRLGELGLEAKCRGLARTHGHRTLDDYYRDVLGVAPSSMAARVVLARRVGRLPRLKAAIEDGAIGFETATLLARVARPATEEAWLALANISTTKIFREHVNAAELHARAQGLALDSLAPPTHEQVDAAGELERKVLTMVFARGTDNCTDSHGPEVAEARTEPEAGPMSVWAFSEEAALGTVPLRLTLPDDLAVFWRDLEVLHADADYPMGTFIAFLVAASLDTWRGFARLPAYGEIYLRDRFRCQNPVCTSRHCTPHHIQFRSRGGGEEPSNLVSLCDRCHLSLVHGGHLAVTGLAPHALDWSARACHIVA